MATTTSTTKIKPENQNLTRSRSLGRKPKPVPSSEPEAKPDVSGRKTNEKPLPNYLKPTISSRPDPVNFLRKNNALEDNHKILRRRSFDRHPSSLTSPSTSSSHKSLNTSPARPRDRPAVPREKHVTVTGLRSTSFHGTSRGGLRGSSTVKSPPVAQRGSPGAKKNGLSKKEGSENVPRRPSAKEISPESSPLAPAHEDEEEIVKVETYEGVSDHRQELKEEDKDQVAQPEESGEEMETGPMEPSKEEERKVTNEDRIEEPKEPEIPQEDIGEDEDEAKKKVDDDEITRDMKEAVNVEESKEEEKTEAKEEEEKRERSKVEEGATETKGKVEELAEEGRKKEVVQGNKESPPAYNDVIASTMQENSRKNKVLALAGAFQTVIDYETAASK